MTDLRLPQAFKLLNILLDYGGLFVNSFVDCFDCDTDMALWLDTAACNWPSNTHPAGPCCNYTDSLVNNR